MFDFKEASNNQSKWQVSAFKFILLSSFFNALIYHRPLFVFAIENLNAWSFSGLQILINLFLMLFVVTALFLYALTMINRVLAKFIFVWLVLFNTLFLFCIETFQLPADKVLNVFVIIESVNENNALMSDFISLQMLVYLFFYAFIPSILIIKFKIEPVKHIGLSLKFASVLVVSLIWFILTYQSVLWINKHYNSLSAKILPWSYVVKISSMQIPKLLGVNEVVKLPIAQSDEQRKTVVVLVLGESARANNFSLYGYDRQTNSNLKQQNVLALSNTRACSASTLDAINCVLSHKNPDFNHYELLPNYLQRSHVAVWWRSNNAVDLDLNVARFETVGDLQKDCHSDGCLTDEVLMKGLLQDIQNSSENKIFIVLHQSGSKGSIYADNYPKFFEEYTPACESDQLIDCTDQSLINAYDNSIGYTDFVLASVIEQLKRIEDRDTLMMYISNHGESLGEFGLYLHGLPKFIAPDVQLQVPFIVWMNDSFEQHHNVSTQIMMQKTSHQPQNIFHSVMGAFDLQSDIYNPSLDIFEQAKQ